MEEAPIPEQPTRRRALAIRFTVAAVVLGMLSTGFVLTLSGHQVSNVFSNISNGLSMGGGGGGYGASSGSSASGSGGGGDTQPGAGSVPTAAANVASLSIGTPPPEVERNVAAAYTIAPGSFQKSFDQVSAETEALGGYVASSTTGSNGRGVVDRGTIVVKVPSSKLSDLLTGLPGSFVESKLNFTTVDHTAANVSATTNLTLAQSQMAALQRALAATTDPNQIQSLSGQIDNLQSQIESLQITINVIQAEVSMSTASISLTERGVVIPAKPAAPPRIVQAASAGLSNDITLGSDTLYLLLSALPVLLVLSILYSQRRRLIALLGIGASSSRQRPQVPEVSAP